MLDRTTAEELEVLIKKVKEEFKLPALQQRNSGSLQYGSIMLTRAESREKMEELSFFNEKEL